MRGWVLREADGVAHPAVALAAAGVAGNGGGDLNGGGWSSGADENDDTVHGRING